MTYWDVILKYIEKFCINIMIPLHGFLFQTGKRLISIAFPL